MNPDTTPTPRTDNQVNFANKLGIPTVATSFARQLERELIEKTNEVARLREDLSIIVCAILKKDGKDVLNQTAMDRLAELHRSEKEFARLRELLNRAIENCECEPKCSSHFASYCDCGRYRRNEEIRADLAALAPAPDEPTLEQAQAVMADFLTNIGKEPAPEWREEKVQ